MRIKGLVTGFGHGVVLYGVYRYSGRAVVLLVSQATVIMGNPPDSILYTTRFPKT